MADVVSEIKELFDSIIVVDVYVRRKPETIDDRSVIKNALWVYAK